MGNASSASESRSERSNRTGRLLTPCEIDSVRLEANFIASEADRLYWEMDETLAQAVADLEASQGAAVPESLFMKKASKRKSGTNHGK